MPNNRLHNQQQKNTERVMDVVAFFGELVRERRNVLGLTQTELARGVGCAAITIRKI